MEAMARRKTKVPNWYLDVTLIRKYWEGMPRTYHHTAPINMYYGLHQALDNLLAEGLEASFARHLAMHERLKQALVAGQLCLHFQPQVQVAGGEVQGVEALLRWHDAKLGWVSPERFVPVADLEKAGYGQYLALFGLAATQPIRQWAEEKLSGSKQNQVCRQRQLDRPCTGPKCIRHERHHGQVHIHAQ